MFFSYQILIRKNGNFAVIWRYMHDRHSRIKVTKKELLQIDIGQACTDLRDYVPTGKLESSEVLNKMSLYLLAQLSYGVTLVLDVQADYLIEDLKVLWNSMLRITPEEGEGVKKKRESGVRKKRKATELEGLERISVEEMLEQEEREETRKKRRTTRSTKEQSLLNLSDPRAYVDHQVPEAVPRREPIGDLHELDEMFMDQTDIRLPPPEWPPLREEAQREEEERRKVSMAAILPSPGQESFMQELEKALEEAATPTGAERGPSPALIEHKMEEVAPSAEQEVPEPPTELMREPVYRQNGESLEAEIMLRSMDELQLDVLPELELRAPRPRRRPRHLIIDDKIQLTTEEMIRNMENLSGILRTREDLHTEIMQRQMPTLKEMLDPVPHHISGLSKELYPLFQTVLKDIHERPLTYAEASRMTEDEMRVRRFDFDVASLRSEPTEGKEDESMAKALELSELIPPPREEPVEEPRRQLKVSVDTGQLQPSPEDLEELGEEAPLLRPSTPLEPPEQIRHARDTLQRTTMTEQSIAPPLMDESYVQPMMEVSMGAEDIVLQRESILIKPSPDIPEEGWLDEEMEQLYSAIVEKQALSGMKFVYYHEVIAGQQKDKKQAARKFFTLLKLLKHGKVKVRQQRPYGEIWVRARGIQGGLDTSMAYSDVGGEAGAE